MSEQIRAAFHRNLQSRGIPSDLFQRDDSGAYEFATVEHDWSVWQAAIAASVASPAAPASTVVPIDMVLFCPACGLQHIDEPEECVGVALKGGELFWDNPPHRSHLCHGCGHVWRPADVPTNGVAAVKTKGTKDSPPHWPLRRTPTGAPGKYDNVLVPFVALMEKELHTNSDKGDRPGWLQMTTQEAVLEVYHHAAKLAKAVRNDNVPLICEHAADVANMAMMLVDVRGALTLAAPASPSVAQAKPSEVRVRIRDAIAESLRDVYVCSRVWSAWSYGTMSEDDFAPASEDEDVLANITDAVLATLPSTPKAEGEGKQS